MTKQKKKSEAQTKRRLINIGPGIMIALALSVFIGAKWVQLDKMKLAQQSTPPIVERQVITSSYEEKLGPTPEIKFVTDRADKLGLSATQRARLQSLQSKWDKTYGPKLAQVNEAAARTNEYLRDNRKARRVPVAQIQDQAAPLIALSGEISTARRAYWKEAAAVLTPAQQKMLEKEREASWAEKQKAVASAAR